MSKTSPPILIVEDDANCREALCDLLRANGHVVLAASNGKQALDILVSGGPKPFLILLDLEMPVMSGWEFLSIVKAYERLASIPVLVTSGRKSTPTEAYRRGTTGHISKPYDLPVLLAKVKAYARPE